MLWSCVVRGDIWCLPSPQTCLSLFLFFASWGGTLSYLEILQRYVHTVTPCLFSVIFTVRDAGFEPGDCCLTQPGPTSLKNVKCKIYVKSFQKCQNRTIISNDLKLKPLHRLLTTIQSFITVEGIEKKTINSRNQNENEIIHTK